MLPICLTILATLPNLPSTPEASPQNVRAAVQRSLPFIERYGTEWMRERKCNSCHTVTFMVWAHNEASAHGLDVDRKKLAEWNTWSVADSLKEDHWFRMRPKGRDALKADGVPDDVIAKFKQMNPGRNFTMQKDFLDAVEKLIGRDALDKHQELILKHSALPRNGGGPDTLAQVLLGRAGLPEDQPTTDSLKAIRALLLEWQEPDGSWGTQGQLPNVKWSGEKEMNDATTMWSLLAVSVGDPKDEETARVQRKALEVLKNSKPGITLQSLALHTIMAHKFGEVDRAEELFKELLAHQNADGGWSWLNANSTSDAFATGQALYALGLLGRDGTHPAVRRAWEYLLRTQEKDGSWDVQQEGINIKKRGLNVYPMWGSSWAAIGLLRTLPGEK